MRSWLWLERSGLAPESGKGPALATRKGNNGKGAKREEIMAIVGKVCDITPPLKESRPRDLVCLLGFGFVGFIK